MNSLLDYACLFSSVLLLAPSAARAAEVLPYTTRTAPYSGYSTNVSGDIRTVGMSGATAGLADTYAASQDNPAGLAMTVKTGDTNYTTNDIHDGHVQSFSETLSFNVLGLAFATEPWGFGIGTSIIHRENAPYLLAPTGPESNLDVSVREYRFSVGHITANKRLSLGASFRLGVASESGMLTASGQELGQTSTNAGFSLGVLYRLPGRVLLGASYSAPMKYDFEQRAAAGVVPTNFFQSVEVPGVLATGVGWIPNRFFRTDLSLHVVQSNSNTALLSDPSARVGEHVTAQPRFGVAYVFSDFRNLKGTMFGGSYYEVSRISTQANRIHATAGAELKVSFVNLGIGIDGAKDYRNFMASVGIDAFNIAGKMGIIPKDPPGEYRGFFPSPFLNTEDGLVGTLRDHPDSGQAINAVEAGMEIPGKIEKKVDKAADEGFGTSVLNVIKSVPSEVDEEIQDMKEVERKVEQKKKKQQTKKKKPGPKAKPSPKPTGKHVKPPKKKKKVVPVPAE